MGLKIPVEGLSHFIGEVPDGSLVLFEGSVELAPTYFALVLAGSAPAAQRKVVLITSRTKETFVQHCRQLGMEPSRFTVIEKFMWEEWEESAGKGDTGQSEKRTNKDLIMNCKTNLTNNGILLIDSFSYMVQDLTAPELRKILEELRFACRSNAAIVMLVSERGMLGPQQEAVLAHLADGVMRFMTREGKEGESRFLRIPKWVGGEFISENIYFAVDGGKMTVDVRSRIV
jgi:KaiC/GvpD/RAD55 family RecA-like ATPase